jgi:hypothetical protein
MKKSIVTVAALVASIVGFAQTSKVSVESSPRGSVYNLKYVSDKATKVNIVITDEDGKTILVDDLYGKNFIRPYNFSQLPQGDYHVAVKNNDGTTELALNHKNETVNPVHTVSVKALENDRFQLTVIGNSADAVVVSIYDNRGELVHSEAVVKKGSFSQIYDLAKIKASGYTVEVSAGEKLVSKVTL